MYNADFMQSNGSQFSPFTVPPLTRSGYRKTKAHAAKVATLCKGQKVAAFCRIRQVQLKAQPL